jgi:transcriptional regulator with XRE-family HTH domain
MKERLLKFLEEESLTAAKFADEIGVQRSSISHILSGRNNPGYDFFQKILKRYPQINAEWLLMGSGKMTKAPKQASLFTVESDVIPEPIEKSTDNNHTETFVPGTEPINQSENEIRLNHENKENVSLKNIEKIVILYTDNSFREYVPSK